MQKKPQLIIVVAMDVEDRKADIADLLQDLVSEIGVPLFDIWIGPLLLLLCKNGKSVFIYFSEEELSALGLVRKRLLHELTPQASLL